MKAVDPTGENDAQKFLSSQNHNQKISHEDELKFINIGQHFAQVSEHRLRKTEHDIPLASCMDYAGITDKTRVRKPPGGDTNDIFDLESRQRSQAATKQMNLDKIRGVKEHQTNSGISNIGDQKNISHSSDTTLSSTQPDPDPSTKTLLLQMDKENLDLLSNASEEDILKKKPLDDEDLKQPAKMYFVRNPITGEVSEVKRSTFPKMSDCSNVLLNPDAVARNPGLVKPSVRVRQPPGGVSSNIF